MKDNSQNLGPNHHPECRGDTWRYSGRGYNRVRACSCGAEDHDPEPTQEMDRIMNRYMRRQKDV